LEGTFPKRQRAWLTDEKLYIIFKCAADVVFLDNFKVLLIDLLCIQLDLTLFLTEVKSAIVSQVLSIKSIWRLLIHGLDRKRSGPTVLLYHEKPQEVGEKPVRK
jgi:hypothetical protein